MTMSASTRDTANTLLLVPSLMPTAVVRPTTKALWAEGMPGRVGGCGCGKGEGGWLSHLLMS